MNRHTSIHNNMRESIVISGNRFSLCIRDILNVLRDTESESNVIEYSKLIPDSDSSVRSEISGRELEPKSDKEYPDSDSGAHPAAASGLGPSAPLPGPVVEGDCESGDPNFRNELQVTNFRNELQAFISTSEMSRLSGVPVDFLRRAADRIGGRKTKTSGPRAGGGPGWRWEFDPGQADRVRLMWIRARKDVLNRVGVTREGVDYRHDGSVSRRDEKHTRKRLASLSRGEARRKMERDSDQASLADRDSGAAGPGA